MSCNVCEAVNEARSKTAGCPRLDEAHKIFTDLGSHLITVCEDIIPLAARLARAEEGRLEAEFEILADLDEVLHLNEYKADK